MKRYANEFIQKMREAKLTIALAESITCGLAANKLSSCIGVSEVFNASLVCYTPEAKMQLLRVKKSTIDACTCESPEVTKEMTLHLPHLVKADMYAAITGLASPDGSETNEKPVGTIFYCILYDGKVYEYRKLYRGTPLEIKKKASIGLYKTILQEILQ